MIERARAAEAGAAPGRRDLADAVARNYSKLLATKDAFEVARLFTETHVLDRLKETFQRATTRSCSISRRPSGRSATGKPVPFASRVYGPWMLRVFRLLASLRRLRNTPLDPFPATADRRLRRRVLAEDERVLDEVPGGLSASNHADAVALASLPDAIRGYGHLRERACEAGEAV